MSVNQLIDRRRGALWPQSVLHCDFTVLGWVGEVIIEDIVQKTRRTNVVLVVMYNKYAM